MKFARRDFLKASAALGGALTLKSTGLLSNVMAATGPDAPPVIWLQGQSCTGCAVSFLNSIYYTTADDLLLNQIDLKFQSNVMAAAGDLAVEAATSAQAAGGYVLILEGAIPFGDNGAFCHLWENTSMVDAVKQFAPDAIAIIALGTCASYGGIYAANPNPTGTMGVKAALATLGINKTVINIPGCPAHPDWLVGTVAALLNGQVPTLDSQGRPVDFYGETVHSTCPNLSAFNQNYAPRISTNHEDGADSSKLACLACHSPTSSQVPNPRVLGMTGCLYALNCKGRFTQADCSVRKWNSGAANQNGQEWCVGAGAPCFGCTEPTFPDGMSPFYPDGVSVPNNDTVGILRAEYHTDTRRLLVEATSSRQSQATLTVSGYGQMTWVSTQNLYRFDKTGVPQPSGNINVSSSLGGAAASAVTVIGSATDTVTITLAQYNTDTRQLLVRAASSRQPDATLTVTGFGQMSWNSSQNYYQLEQTGIAQPSGSINVTSSLGGSAASAITVIGGATNDTVTVTLAQYSTDTQELLVRATSSRQPDATLTVTGFGTMTWNSTQNYYQLQKTGVSQPGSVTVTSSLGGSASRTVTVVGTTTDTVKVILAEYRTSNRELLVRATSSRQPTASLRVTGYGQMYWTSAGYYQLRKQNVSRPATVTVTSSLGGSGSLAVTVVGSGTTADTVRITRAEYTYDGRELVVEATSSRQPNATLTVVNYGTMTWSSYRKCYRLRRTGVSRPSSVTVKSSLGGTATRSVSTVSDD